MTSADIVVIAARIAALVSEFVNADKKKRKRRQAAGIAKAPRANGGKCPWGGRKRGSTKVKDAAKRVRELRQRGFSVSEIAT
jgi:DNA invertase Pin-like site-specific DNA recombinase